MSRILRLLPILVLLVALESPAATFVVDTTSDSALGACSAAIAEDCSLRGAIAAANLTPAADIINFAIPQSDAGFQAATAHWRFAPATELPFISNPLTIDGFTQTGAAPSSHLPLAPIGHVLKIELRGASMSNFNCLLAGGSLTLRGLAINNCNQAIFLFDSGIHVIEGNYLGTDITGTSTVANRVGVALGGDVRIGGLLPAQANLISGNRLGALVQFRSVTRLLVQGNTIGPNRLLTAAQGLQDNGISLLGPYTDVVIGGTVAAAANLIGGNTFNAISISDQPRGAPGAPLVRIVGNVIGLGTGGIPLGNGLNQGSGQTVPSIQVSLLGNCRVAIGGDGAGEGNIIAHGGNAAVAINACWGAPILGNAFLANRRQPIDLATTNGFDGPTANDAGDFDGTGTDPFAVSAGNRLQNTAEVETVIENAGNNQLRIALRVDSAPTAATYPLRIDFHATDEFGVQASLSTQPYALADAQALREYILPLNSFRRGIGITVTDAEGNTGEMLLIGTIFVDGFEDVAAGHE